MWLGLGGGWFSYSWRCIHDYQSRGRWPFEGQNFKLPDWIHRHFPESCKTRRKTDGIGVDRFSTDTSVENKLLSSTSKALHDAKISARAEEVIPWRIIVSMNCCRKIGVLKISATANYTWSRWLQGFEDRLNFAEKRSLSSARSKVVNCEDLFL